MNSFELKPSLTSSKDKFCLINALGTRFKCNIEDLEISELTGGEVKKIADMKLFIGEGLKFYSNSKTIFVWGVRSEKDEVFRRLFAIYSNYGAKSFEELLFGLIKYLREAMNEKGMGNYSHKILNELISEIEQPILEAKFYDIRFIKSIKILNPPKGTLIKVLNQAILEGHNVEISDSVREFEAKGVVISLTKDRKSFYKISYDIDKIKTWIKQEVNNLIDEKLKSGRISELITDKEDIKELILYKIFEHYRRTKFNPLAGILWKIGRREEAVMEARLGENSFINFVKKIILFLVLLILIPPFFAYFNEYMGLIFRISMLLIGILMLFISGKEKYENKDITHELILTKEDLEENFNYFRDSLRKLVENKCIEILGKRKEISEKEIENAKDLETLIDKIVEEYFGSPDSKDLGVRG
ncbi:MAG: hypothetical protein QXL14_02995 [Candidatus Aenigmatarchaeota archaeon]